MSKSMHNTCNSVPKCMPCSPYLFSSTSMLVWSGFFYGVTVNNLLPQPPQDWGALLWVWPWETAQAKKGSPAPFSTSCLEYSIHSQRNALTKKLGIFWWECEWGWEEQEGSSYQVIFNSSIFLLLLLIFNVLSVKEKKRNDVE